MTEKKKCLHDADTKTKSGGLSPGGGIDRGSGGRTGVWVGNPRVCILPRPYLAKHPLYSHHIIPPPPPKKKINNTKTKWSLWDSNPVL